MVYRASDFIGDLWVYSVKHTGKDGFGGLPYDSENCHGDEKTNDRVRERIAQPDPDSTKEHGQTGETVYPGVMTVSDESGAADFLTNPYTELSYCLIADEPNHRCNYYSPQILDGLRVEEAINGLVARNNCAKQNSEYNSYACQVFYAAVAIGKSFSGFPACKSKSNPQRNSSGSVANIMNRVSKERHTSSKHNDNDLKSGGSE
jgi:hypothetical protein